MKFLTNLTLGRKIALLTTLGLILAVGVFSFLAIRAVNQATEAMLQDRLTTAQLVANYLDEALQRALTELKNTAQLIASDETGRNLELRIKALEDAYSRLSIYTRGIYLLDETGQVVWSEPESSVLDLADMSLYPNISRVLREDQANISGLVPTPQVNTPVILLVAPTREGEQGGKGAMVVTVDPSQSSIGNFVQSIRLGQTGYVEIVDENGVVVIRTEPGPKLAPFEKSDHTGRFAALIAAGKPTRGVCHTCHEPLQKVERRDVLAFIPLSQARWGVVIRQSEEEALAPIEELRQNLLFFGVGLIIVTLAFVIMVTRGVVNYVRMLTTASQRIAGGDLTTPVATSRKDEIGILAQNFEDMRTKLKTSRDELEQRTRELSALLSVSEILTSLPDLSNLDTALGSALDKTLEIIGTNTGGILLWDEEKQKLRYRVYRGLSSSYAKGVSLSLGEGIAGQVAQTGEAVLLEDVSKDHRAAYPDLIIAEKLRGFASVPLRAKEKVLGVLNIAGRGDQRFPARDVRLLEGIASQIAIAIENARLHQEVQRKDEIRGELLREIFSIQEEERSRIARELHDETSQVLAGLTAHLEAASGMLPVDLENVRTRLKEAQALSVNALDEIHRLIYELRPSLLDDLGLVTAVRWLTDNNLPAIGIKVKLKVVGQVRRLNSQLEATLFRVIQEAVNNIVKHARAKNANITLQFRKNAVSVCIKDDGLGFDVAEVMSSRGKPRGLGLLGMRERIELVNGSLSIRSHPGGGGTQIDIEIPVNKEVFSE